MIARNSRKSTHPAVLPAVDMRSPEDCIIGTDLEGTILTWNVGAEKLFGYPAGQMIGQKITVIFLPEHSTDDPVSLWSPTASGDEKRFYSVRLRQDGVPIPVSAILSTVRNEYGQIAGISALYRPLTKIVSRAVVQTTRDVFAPISLGDARRPKVLLATAGAGGTIAAVRRLHEHGFDVNVVSSERLGSAAWSNRVAHAYKGPRESDGEGFIRWLMANGEADPGQILLATSDQTSWLYTMHAPELSRYFRLYQPSIATMRVILDKNLFAEAAVRAGLSILPSWEPRNIDDLLAVAATLPYPILIKPRTHVHRLRNDKGLVAFSKEELIERYSLYVEMETIRGADNPHLPDAGLPILQQFVNVAKEGVYSVSGFLDRSGEMFVTRRSVKVLQRSQPVGVGVCFESRPAAPALSDAVRRLCKEMNYFGMFEVEFIRFGQSWAAIDFNPRLFNQVGMDIYRGMPLPVLACLDAMGDTAGLREAVTKAQQADENAQAVFCDRFTMNSIFIAKTLTGRMSRSELSTARAWWKEHAGHAVDFALDGKDRMPGIIHVMSEIYLGIRAFPKFLRLTPRTSAKSPETLAKVRT